MNKTKRKLVVNPREKNKARKGDQECVAGVSLIRWLGRKHGADLRETWTKWREPWGHVGNGDGHRGEGPASGTGETGRGPCATQSREGQGEQEGVRARRVRQGLWLLHLVFTESREGWRAPPARGGPPHEQVLG